MAVAQLKVGKLDARKARLQLYRELILEAAEREFAACGFEQTKVQDIAATADLSLATLYNAFRSKDEIHADIHRMRIAALVARAVSSQVPGRSALENLLAGLATMLEFFTSHPNYLRMHLRDGISWATESGIAAGDARDAWRQGIDLLAGVVAEGMQQGEFRDMQPRLAAQLIVASTQVWLAHWVDSGASNGVADLIEQAQNFVRRSFLRSSP